jgi:hypothetical protein
MSAVSASELALRHFPIPGAVSATHQDTHETEAVSACEGAVHHLHSAGPGFIPAGEVNTTTDPATVLADEDAAPTTQPTEHTLIPEGVSPAIHSAAVSASQVHHNRIYTGAVSVPEGVSPAIDGAAVSVSRPLVDPSAVSSTPLSPPNTHREYNTATSPAKAHSQYVIYYGTTDFRAYKQQKGINGNVYGIKDPSLHKGTTPAVIADDGSERNGPLNHIFSAFFDLPILYTEGSIQSFLAMNNKDDTLTQSQMLCTSDSEHFVNAQINEIRGLEKLNVFKCKPIHDLPPKAKLLSSIWSYRRK